MFEAGNTSSPVYQLCLMKNLPFDPPDLSLPEWIETFVFEDTNDHDIPFTNSEPNHDNEKAFYESEIQLSKEERFRLCALTQFQNDKKWRRKNTKWTEMDKNGQNEQSGQNGQNEQNEQNEQNGQFEQFGQF